MPKVPQQHGWYGPKHLIPEGWHYVKEVLDNHGIYCVLIREGDWESFNDEAARKKIDRWFSRANRGLRELHQYKAEKARRK